MNCVKPATVKKKDKTQGVSLNFKCPLFGQEKNMTVEKDKCHVCNRTEPDWFNSRCEEHDVCLTCGINRKDLTETPWGAKGGFICKPCEDQRIKDKIEAWQSQDPEDIDLYSFDKIICPNCGHEHEADCDDSAFYADGTHDYDCAECNYKFEVETTISYSYETSKK
jgi:hypothetical protein